MPERTDENNKGAIGAAGPIAPQRVYIYTDSRPPEPDANGPGLVICSQVQAFLDLGCEVEFVFIWRWDKLPSSPGYFREIKCTVVNAQGVRAPRYARLAYLAKMPRELAWWQLYPAREIILREAKARYRIDPKAIHVFHYLHTANVIPSLPMARTIWTCHDIESEYQAGTFRIDQEIQKRQPYSWETRKLRRMAELERKVARSSGLVLCVASDEAKRIAEEWSAPHAAYLPFSIMHGEKPVTDRQRGADGVLRLLHIGGLVHLATYSSLEFLFTKVFPLLDADTLSRLSLEVVGKWEAGEIQAEAIMEMAKPYPMVHFSGFVEDIRSAYGRNDLQVVASTQATGVRTRVIESWAYGMPVLSTTMGAGGVEHVAPGKNILIADDPHDYAQILKELIYAPGLLSRISIAARITYEEKYGRQAVALALRDLLNARFNLQLGQVTRS
jgi:glycosyltransferase involved in cell wall biosynthesis